jgi:hypothetical protein
LSVPQGRLAFLYICKLLSTADEFLMCIPILLVPSHCTVSLHPPRSCILRQITVHCTQCARFRVFHTWDSCRLPAAGLQGPAEVQRSLAY